jgi:plastocyanin
MKRPTALVVLALLLLVAAAFLMHREPREEKPARAPRPAPVVETAPPEPVAAVPEPPKPAPPPPPKPMPPPSPRLPEPPPVAVDRSQLGVIRGSVKIRGKVPPRKPVRMEADPHCAALHAGVVLNDDLVVDPKGGVRWAFVYVKSGLKAAPPPVSQTPVLLDQIGCVFTPHVLGVRVGQPLQVRNSDPRLHNVHALSFNNVELNVCIVPDTEHAHRFTKREVMVRVKCDMHPWMSAWVGVLDHPYFAVTGEEGAFAIPDLPPGRYAVEVWHEKYVSVSREVDVIIGDEYPLDFLLDARKP